MDNNVTNINEAGGEVPAEVQLATFGEPVKAALLKAFPKILKIEQQRAELNAKISAEIKALSGRGLHQKAVNHLYVIWKMDPDKRAVYQHSFDFGCASLDIDLGIVEDEANQPMEDATG